MNELITTDASEVVTKSTVDENITTLVDNIMEEQDPTRTKDLVDMFNWNMSKKNIARIQKLSYLYDSITDQMVERIDKRADQFSNSDLLDYVKTIQTAIDLNTKNLTAVQEPSLIVQQHNTQINVNIEEKFDRDAKARIMDAVKATLNQLNNSGPPTVVVDVEESSNEQ